MPINSSDEPNLINQEDVKVPAKYSSSLKKILSITDDLKEENGFVVLSGESVSKLRWYVLSYLNFLESILVAWQYSIVDREIIEHQFSYLFSPEQGHEALKKFRVAAGGEKSFPAIEIFTNHLQEKRKEILKEKANVA